jgi:protein O-mannosyl-transferase
MVWFHQPKLPRDVMNNPLLEASPALRAAGASGVYGAGWLQLLFPWSLSGDYSFPQETIPQRPWGPASLLGGGLFIVPLVLGAFLLLRRPAVPSHSLGRLAGLGMLWVPLAYLPHSNLFVLLPTVRAERFWYLPALGSSLLLAVIAAHLLASGRVWAKAIVIAFLGFQALQARAHALHYSDDAVFWRATKVASPRSAKAHLNHAVMMGARGDLAARLDSGKTALRLAPEWAMGHVYQGDALCRLGRLDEAWVHYLRGFQLDPNSQGHVALALQCLWDRGAIEGRRERLLQLAAEHPGTWLAYLASDIVHNGQQHHGVDPNYRPRGYNRGPAHRSRSAQRHD